MASKPHTLMSWKRDANFGVYGPDNEFVAEFTHDADAAYAVKAANMHERLVDFIRTNEWDDASPDGEAAWTCYCGKCGGKQPNHDPGCEKAALLKEAEDAS